MREKQPACNFLAYVLTSFCAILLGITQEAEATIFHVSEPGRISIQYKITQRNKVRFVYIFCIDISNLWPRFIHQGALYTNIQSLDKKLQPLLHLFLFIIHGPGFWEIRRPENEMRYTPVRTSNCRMLDVGRSCKEQFISITIIKNWCLATLRPFFIQKTAISFLFLYLNIYSQYPVPITSKTIAFEAWRIIKLKPAY